MIPLYVSRPLLNAEELHRWAVEAGFTDVLVPAKMHLTVAYSTTPVDHQALTLDSQPLTISGGFRALAQIGSDGAVVLRLDHPHLHRRWQALLDQGATWDFRHTPGMYLPHVTLSYSAQDPVRVATTAPYPGEIQFGAEHAAPLQRGWGGSAGTS